MQATKPYLEVISRFMVFNEPKISDSMSKRLDTLHDRLTVILAVQGGRGGRDRESTAISTGSVRDAPFGAFITNQLTSICCRVGGNCPPPGRGWLRSWVEAPCARHSGSSHLYYRLE